MKKILCLSLAVMMMTGCGFMKNSTSGKASQTTNTASTGATTTALNAGQGAGNAILQLYNQYKEDGNKYDYTNMQNVLNTITLLVKCEELKNNCTDKKYLAGFSKGLVASSLGLVTQDNVEIVTNSLVDMVKSNETVQTVTTQAQNTASTAVDYANTAADYANTAARYAGAIGTLLSAFSK